MDDLLARGAAAEGMMQGDMGPPSPEQTAEMPDDAGAMDLEGALAALDQAISTLPPDKQEEARNHMNAIREIASGDPGVEQVEASPQPPAGEEPKMEVPL